MKIYRSILMLLVAVATMTACDKNAVGIIAAPQEGGVNVKFFNFAVGAPNVNFFVNDSKVTAVSATGCAVLTDENRQQCLSSGLESTSGVAYGSAGNGANAWYSDVAPGQVTISGRISATTDKNLAISTLQASISEGKFYSFYLSGIYNTTSKTAESFIIEDVMPPSDFTVAYVRFVNASSTAQPMTLYLINPTDPNIQAPFGGLVAYKSASEFVSVPVATGFTGVSANLGVRVAGSTTNAFSRAAVSFAAGRAYTITLRGNTASASTMALDVTANR